MTDPDIREFRKHLRAIEREVVSLLKGETDCCGVTLAQCHALIEIAEAGKTNIVDLSQQLGLDTSTLSRTVDSLVKAGFVTREPDPGNRRYVQLHLTGPGKDKVEFINGSCDKFYTRLLGKVPKNRRSMLAESVKLLASLLAGAAGTPCEPVGCSAPGVVREGRMRRGRQG